MWIIMVTGLMIMTLMVGCVSDETAQISKKVVLADQYGLAYAPLEIMKHEGLLEKYYGDAIEVEWVKMANTTAIYEAMNADQLDVGFVGIPPFVIAKDKGMDWKILCGLSQSPLGLTTNVEGISSLEDLVEAGQIALPQPGSIQHILLAMAAEKTLGDSSIFDHQLVAMKHPDGMQAMLNVDEVVAHFTSPPYLFMEMAEEGVHEIVSGEDAMGGPFTFIVAISEGPFAENEFLNSGFRQALSEAMTYIEDYPYETAQILAESYNLSVEDAAGYMAYEGMVYESEVMGLETFVDFMFRNGTIENAYERADLIWNETGSNNP